MIYIPLYLKLITIFSKNLNKRLLSNRDAAELDVKMSKQTFVTESVKTEHNSSMQNFQYRALKYNG